MNSDISDIIEKISNNKADLGITLYEPASLSEISGFENRNAIKLPDDLVTFYSFCNGFESEEDIFRIIPLDEISSNNKDRNTYTVEANDFHIAEYMIYCDMWTININPTNKNDYKIYNKAETVVTLTNSFANFLEVFLNGGVFDGLYKWRENIEDLTK